MCRNVSRPLRILARTESGGRVDERYCQRSDIATSRGQDQGIRRVSRDRQQGGTMAIRWPGTMIRCCLWGFLLNVLIGPAFAAPPNVVIIVVDDLGASDLGCYGSKFHKTPHADRLAAAGVRLTQAYAAAPVGVPTRAAILTGQYPQRWNLTAAAGIPHRPDQRFIPPTVREGLPMELTTLAEALKTKGYISAAIGKWNLGGSGSSPRDHGFDLQMGGTADGRVASQHPPYRDSLGQPLAGLDAAEDSEWLTDRLALEAERFLERERERPFFLYLATYGVGEPLDAPAEMVARYGPMPPRPNGGQIHPVYAAMLESVDNAIGRVVKKLEELKLDDRTLVILTSDNGGVCNHHGQIIPPTSNGPWRDGKGHLYDGGLRVPMIVKWPGIVRPGTTSDTTVSCLDLYPTILSACDIPPGPVDGVNLKPILEASGPVSREALYWHFPHYGANAGSRPGAAVRAGDWKLIEFLETGRRELFHVGPDSRESNNLIAAHADVAEKLAGMLTAWQKTVGAKAPTESADYRPNEPGEDGQIVIPASTADVLGITLRYEPIPNKDTLGYWVRAEDTARLEFTVRTPGRYHVIPHVGCGTSGGSEVDFEVAGQTLKLTVPATGGFQAFVPQDLGIVSFEKPGRYDIVIRPRTKVGVAVMDVRRIVIKPVEVAEREQLPGLRLDAPFWNSTMVTRESVMFVRDDSGLARGKLLFPATRIIAVHSADGRVVFAADRDYRLASDGTLLERTDSSRIPFLPQEDLFPPPGKFPQWARDVSPGPQSIPHKRGKPQTHLLFNNGHWFHDQQVEVTYERRPEPWPGPVPQFASTQLPKTLARLKARQPLTIAVSGDSISHGCNASGWAGTAPFMPSYSGLVSMQLQATYGSQVTLHNRAVGGWSVPNGLNDLDNLLATKPDLILIAYGMNDVGRRDPEAYSQGIRQMIDRIQKSLPESEIILVATMLGNDQWQHTPRDMFPKYRDVLAAFCGPGVALVDLTALWTEMLARKRDCDLTGNGVNHPSDFGHRVYASAVLALLLDPATSKASPASNP